MDGLDCFGCDVVGFDWGGLLSGAGGLASGIISSVEEDKKKAATSAEMESNLTAAITADINATFASARADMSSQAKSPTAAVDASAAVTAASAQDRAASKLSSEAAAKRAEAADKALAAAIKSAQENPTDTYKAALVKAWTSTANKTHSASIVVTGTGPSLPSSESWFTRPVLGPIPGYGVVLGGAGALTILGLVVRKLVMR